MNIACSLSALALIALSSAAFAADEPVAADYVGLIAGGFADGATVFIDIDSFSFKRLAPGTFEGVAATNGKVAKVEIVEAATACVFDIAFTTTENEIRAMQIDVGRIDTIAFTEGSDAGPGLKIYEVNFTGEADLATHKLPDGTISPLGTRTNVITSVPLDELEAGAARLQRLCPPR